MSPRRRDALLVASLLALSALFAWWFRGDRHLVATLIVFTAPPLLLAIGVLLRRPTARFWSGVLALGWFSHGVMSAWSHRDTAGLAALEIVLALAIVLLVSIPGLQARFARRRAS